MLIMIWMLLMKIMGLSRFYTRWQRLSLRHLIPELESTQVTNLLLNIHYNKEEKGKIMIIIVIKGIILITIMIYDNNNKNDREKKSDNLNDRCLSSIKFTLESSYIVQWKKIINPCTKQGTRKCWERRPPGEGVAAQSFHFLSHCPPSVCPWPWLFLFTWRNERLLLRS